MAAEAGVQRAAEALVVEHGERVEANAGLVVELTAVRRVTAAHLALRLLTDEAFMSACRRNTHVYNKTRTFPPFITTLPLHTRAALLTQQLVVRFEAQAQTEEVKRPTALPLTQDQVLTCLLTHLQTGNTSTHEPLAFYRT